MSGDALSVRPIESRPDASGPGSKSDLFAAVLLGRIDQPDHPSVRALARRADADARAAVRNGRASAGAEDVAALRLAYETARDAAAAVKPISRVEPTGARWQRAYAALAALRHRQRSALALYYVLGLPLEDVATVIGCRPTEARKVVEAGVARALTALGEPFDVRRALRIAGARLIAAEAPQVAAAKPARMPRGVVRTLLAPPEPSAADEPVPERPVPYLLRARRPEPLVTGEVLERLEAEGSDITPPPPPPAAARDIVPLRPRPRRSPPRRHLALAAAIVAVLLAALLPAGASDRSSGLPSGAPGQRAVMVEQPDASGVERAVPAVERAVPAVPQVLRVRTGDSLWRLAEVNLGDPLRWREIWRLNRGKVMTDGDRFRDPSLIRPGWRLRLPDR